MLCLHFPNATCKRRLRELSEFRERWEPALWAGRSPENRPPGYTHGEAALLFRRALKPFERAARAISISLLAAASRVASRLLSAIAIKLIREGVAILMQASGAQ